MPQFFYFDLGNVLLYFDHERACRQMGALCELSPAAVRAAVFANGLQDAYERGEVDDAAFYARFCELTGRAPPQAALLRAAADIFWPNEEILPLVDAVARGGRRLGILSNTCSCHWNFCLDAKFACLQRTFDVTALSYELGAMKPDPAIFARAAELAAVSPETIFFVDDRPEHVAAAKAAGWDAVAFHDAQTLAQDLQQRGVQTT